MTHASLFSGIGGFDLAAEWMGWQNVFNCEIDPFCRKVLAYHFPKAKQYEDVKSTDFTIHRGHIDVLTGGFPCQPFSLAGKRKGSDDNRYLWPEMLRAIREIQPRWVVGENVFGIVNWSGGMVFEQVQSDLEDEGYEVQPYIIPACAVDAPHRRDRVWFVAHRRDAQDTLGDGFVREPRNGEEKSNKWQQRMPCTGDSEWICDEKRIITSDGSHAGSEILQQEGAIAICKSTALAHAQCGRSNALHKEVESCKSDGHFPDSDGGKSSTADLSCPGQSPRSPRQRTREAGRGDSREIWRWDFSKFPTQSPVCSGDDGLSDRLDAITFPAWRRESIKAYGNAVVPQIPYLIFQTIEAMTKIRIYISGPISGLPYEQVRRRFEQVKKALAMADFEPVSPLENGLPPEAPWEEHMKRDLEILATCDGIYLQTGWENSKGCRIELNAALTLPQIRIIIKETIKTPKINKTRCETKVT